MNIEIYNNEKILNTLSYGDWFIYENQIYIIIQNDTSNNWWNVYNIENKCIEEMHINTLIKPIKDENIKIEIYC